MSRYGTTILFVSTRESPEGIHAYKYDEDPNGIDGCWTRHHTYKMSPPPTYLRLNGRKDVLYALNSVTSEKEPRKVVGKLHAIEIEPKMNGKMAFLNAVELEGERAFCLCFSSGDQHAVVGQKGSIAAFVLGPRGEVLSQTCANRSCRVESGTIYHTFPTQLEFVPGESEPPKIVALNTADNSNIMTMLDFDMRLGAIGEEDRIMPSWTHQYGITKFALDWKWFVVHKLTSTFSVYQPKQLEKLEERNTVPDDLSPPGNVVEDVIVPYRGKLMYISNRGHNSLTIVRYSSGALADPLFKLMPSGVVPTFMSFQAENLFVASDDDIYIFEINTVTGQLSDATPPKIEILKPICMTVYGKTASVVEFDEDVKKMVVEEMEKIPRIEGRKLSN